MRSFSNVGRSVRGAGLACLLLGLQACTTAQHLTDRVTDMVLGAPATAGSTRISGFIGAVVADEPVAAAVAREVLATGGNAADAAAAAGFALAVTYPSRAGLGGGGACLAYSPARTPGGGVPEAIIFTPAAGGGGGDRPAAVPMLARGMFALNARYGSQELAQLIAPAERLARSGFRLSRPLADDLRTVGGALLADPEARAVFAPGGTPVAEGGAVVQPALATTLAHLRLSGVGDMYLGELARRLVIASRDAGGPISTAALRRSMPGLARPLLLPAGADQVAFLPPPADGGLGAAAAFAMLQSQPGDVAAASARAAAVVAAWRAAGGKGDPMALLRSASTSGAGLPALPASTSLVVIDPSGMAVGCAMTMDNLFGTGRIAPGTGILLAASPAAAPPPLLAAAIAWSPADGLRAVAASSGQQGAALATAQAIDAALRHADPAIAEPGRADLISCPAGLPGAPGSCRWRADPRGGGAALGGTAADVTAAGAAAGGAAGGTGR